MTLPEDRWLITASPLQNAVPTWRNSAPFEAEFPEPPLHWGITSQAPAMETAMAPLNLLTQLEGPREPSTDGIYESPLDPFALSSSPGWELVLVVDTGLSMQPWFSTANAIAACAHDLPLFHNVRVLRMSNRQGKPLTFAPDDASSLSTTPADTNRRCMILLLTDGVGPIWHRPDILARLREWAAHHVVAILQTLPHPQWELTALSTRPARLRAPIPGCTNGALVVHEAEEPQTPAADSDGPAPTLIPVLELRKRWIEQWVRLLLTNSRVHQHIVAIPAGALDTPFIPRPAEPLTAASDRVAAFQSSVPESTYELAKRLAMAPLNRYVMDLIADKSEPAATPSDLSRILTSNLLVAYEQPAELTNRYGRVTFGFADGVRQCLLALSESIHTYQTAELLERHLADAMPPLTGLTSRLRKPAPQALPAITSQTLPLLRVEASLLTALSAESEEHRTTAEHLRAVLDAHAPLQQTPMPAGHAD